MSENTKRLQQLLPADDDCQQAWEAVQLEHKYLLSRISHEIRNPVTLINSFLQLLVHEHPEIQDYNYWSKIMENMDFLRSLLADLSVYNNAGKLQLIPENLYKLLTSIVESARSFLEHSGIRISLIKESAVPRIPLDTIRMQQVFNNLIRNAAEAMPEGGDITITVSCDGSCIKTDISNTGALIPPEDLDSLFQPFVTHKKDGSGLGLAIVHEIIAAHKGTISVQSSTAIPTTFSISLPI